MKTEKVGARSRMVHGYILKELLTELNKLHRTGDFESRLEGNRRAVVFYVDKGQFLSYLTWCVSYQEHGAM